MAIATVRRPVPLQAGAPTSRTRVRPGNRRGRRIPGERPSGPASCRRWHAIGGGHLIRYQSAAFHSSLSQVLSTTPPSVFDLPDTRPRSTSGMIV